jgi:hypothetical protein
MRVADTRLVASDRHRIEGRLCWLDVYCGGRKQVKPVDLAAVDSTRRRASPA